MSDLWLGTRGDEGRVELPRAALLRHVMALGSSGSGKTVFCKVLTEAAALAGIPALCVDPQGDLCSLAAGTLDDAELEERGVDPALAKALRDTLEIVIFTPGSARGVPLCADPIDPGLKQLAPGERVEAITRTAAMVVGLLGFDLDSDDGAGLAAVVDRAIHSLASPSLSALTDHLFAAGEGGYAEYSRYLDAKKIRTACQRLARLDVGARRLLFHDGVPIDIDVLLGRDPRAPVAPGKTRVAIVYLNTLHQQEDKDFFVAALVDRLYSWMLVHPSADPQALFYIDEVAPFIPPVRKPACKDGLALLFKQARKYGVCCLMATQNPGDVDYRAMAQFGTWALGRLTTRQDLKKVEPTIKSLAPERSDEVIGRLPSLKPGELVLLSPDHWDEPIPLQTRWLITKHETWNDERVEQHTDAMRERWDGLVGRTTASPEPEPETETETEPETAAEAETAAETETAADPVLAALLSVSSASVRELVQRVGKSDGAIRRSLGKLLASDDVSEYPVGRGSRYWAPAGGGRPDIGMPRLLDVLAGHIDEDDAKRIGVSMARTKMLGVLGDEEALDGVEPLHRLVFSLSFEEKVARPLFQRLFGDSHDERVGHVYVHPHDFGIVVFGNAHGVRFVDESAKPASDLSDFDGVFERERKRPSDLAFEEVDWTRRSEHEAVKKSFEERFDATPGTIEPLFVPLWTLYFRNQDGGRRKVQIDALVGKLVQWPSP